MIKTKNNKDLFYTGIVIIIFLAIGLTLLLLNNTKSKAASLSTDDLMPIRIGWQTTWATQGQLTEVLKNTDLLEQNNLQGEFVGFASGASLNEAALGGSVDVIFTADQPAATLLSKSDDWVIISRLMYNRVSLYVPPNSPIKNISDLKGKTVGVPFGAAAQRMLIKAEKDAGLDPVIDVKNINLGIYEQAALVRDPNTIKWDTIDALAGFDPTPAILEERGLIRNLKEEKIVSVILMSKSYIIKNPDAPTQFLNAFKDSYDYYRLNPDQANTWFIADAKLNISKTSLDTSAKIEPNLKVGSKNEIQLGFSDDDYRIMQEASDFLYENKMITKLVIMKDHVDLSYLNKLE